MKMACSGQRPTNSSRKHLNTHFIWRLKVDDGCFSLNFFCDVYVLYTFLWSDKWKRQTNMKPRIQWDAVNKHSHRQREIKLKNFVGKRKKKKSKYLISVLHLLWNSFSFFEFLLHIFASSLGHWLFTWSLSAQQRDK